MRQLTQAKYMCIYIYIYIYTLYYTYKLMNDGKKKRNQTSNWTDSETGVGRAREERVSRKKITLHKKMKSFTYM